MDKKFLFEISASQKDKIARIPILLPTDYFKAPIILGLAYIYATFDASKAEISFAKTLKFDFYFTGDKRNPDTMKYELEGKSFADIVRDFSEFSVYSEEVTERILSEVAPKIDGVSDDLICYMFQSMKNIWNSNKSKMTTLNEAISDATYIMIKFITKFVSDELLYNEIVHTFEESQKIAKGSMISDRIYPIGRFAKNEPRFVISVYRNDKRWCARIIKNRASFPKKWENKYGANLYNATKILGLYKCTHDCVYADYNEACIEAAKHITIL